MSVAGIVLPAWKLPVYQRHLAAAGYACLEEPMAFTPGTLLLRVPYEWVHELQSVLAAAQAECQLRTANEPFDEHQSKGE